jgi:hypothetical protein
MRLAKEVNMMKALMAAWSADRESSSISFDDVITRATSTGDEYSNQDLASFLNTISSCVGYQGQRISWVDLKCLEDTIKNH